MKFLFCCVELTLGVYPSILDTAFIGLEVQNPGPVSPKHIPPDMLLVWTTWKYVVWKLTKWAV